MALTTFPSCLSTVDRHHWKANCGWEIERIIMISDWAGEFSRLKQLTIFDYYKKGMPEFVEPLITELVSSFGTYSELEQRKIVTAAVRPEISGKFGWYARKMAGRAVRESSRTDLWNGLVAKLISAGFDFRDELPVMALLYNSAARLGGESKILARGSSENLSRRGIGTQALRYVLEKTRRTEINSKFRLYRRARSIWL
jgi:hypothetical protein